MTPEYLAKHTQLTNQELVGLVENFVALAPSDEANAALEKLRSLKFNARQPGESALFERQHIIAVLNIVLLNMTGDALRVQTEAAEAADAQARAEAVLAEEAQAAADAQAKADAEAAEAAAEAQLQAQRGETTIAVGNPPEPTADAPAKPKAAQPKPAGKPAAKPSAKPKAKPTKAA